MAAALAAWPGASEVAVVDIDPDLADTAAMSEAYDIPMTAGGNCVVVPAPAPATSGSPPAWSAPTPAPT